MNNLPSLDFNNLVQQLLGDLQSFAEQTASAASRDQLLQIQLPTATAEVVTTTRNGVQTTQQAIVRQRLQDFEARNDSLRQGLQQRQQVIQSIAQLRRDIVLQPNPDRFVVAGRLTDEATGQGLPNVTVRAFDLDRRRNDLLGTVTTDANGFYRIEYDAEMFREDGENEPEVFIEVLDADGEQLYRSETGFRLGTPGHTVGQVERIDVRLDGARLPASRNLAANITALRDRQLTVLNDRQRLLANRPVRLQGFNRSE